MFALAKTVIETPGRAALAGLAIALVLMLVWLLSGGADAHGTVAFVLRWTHVLAGIKPDAGHAADEHTMDGGAES